MEGLKCPMKGHEDQLIQAICYNRKCQAKERILCFRCIREFHSDCQNNYYSEEEMKNNVKQHFIKCSEEKVDVQKVFNEIHIRFNQSLSQNKFILEANQMQNEKHKEMFEKFVQSLQTKTLSKELWYQGYSFMNNDAILEVDHSKSIEVMNSYLLEMQETFKDLLQLKRSIQIPQQLISKSIIQCNWTEATIYKSGLDEFQNPESYYVNSISCSRDGKYICFGGSDQKIDVWDPSNQKQALVYWSHSSCIFDVSFSPDSKHIVSSDQNGVIQIWESKTGKQICQSIKLHSSTVWSVSYSPDGSEIVSGGSDRTIARFDSLTGQQLGKSLTGHQDTVMCVRYSPKGKFIISGSEDKTVRVWNILTQMQYYAPLSGHSAPVKAVSYSSNGRFIISGSLDQSIRIWNSTNGLLVRQLTEVGPIESFSISPDSQTFASAGEKINIWDFEGRKIQELTAKHYVMSVSYSPDGNFLTIASQNNQVQIVDVCNHI